MSLVRSRLAPVVVLVAVAIVALGVTQPPTTALAADDYLVIGRAELLALPTSGTAWEFVKSTADATWGPVDLANQDSKVDSQAIAAALVYARTGDTTYRAKVVGALRDLQAWRGSVDSLAWFRQVGGFAIAADLADYRDPSFVAYLAEMRTSSPNDPDGQGDHAVWSNPVVTHEDSVNNYGAFAGATRVAISAYLGDTVDLASAWNVYQGFLGNRSAYSGFRGQVSDLYAAAKPWACDTTRAGFVPVNGPCSSSGVDLDGVIPGDAYRDELGLLYPLPRLSKGIGYTQETLQGLLVQAEIFERAGYRAYAASNQALRRAAAFVSRNQAAGGGGWNEYGVNRHLPWLLNYRYGTSVPAVAAGYGRAFGFTDWLYGGRSAGAPVASSTPSATPTPTPTPTPVPTATPGSSPAATPSPSEPPAASATPAPTSTPSPAPTATPTADGISYRSSSAAAAQGTALTVPTPAGAVAGDVLVAAIDVRGSLSTSVTPPTGFDLVRRDVNGTSLTTAVYTHVVRATDPLSHTFQFSRSQGSTGIILAFSGVDGASPVVSSGAHAQSQTARITAPSVSGSTAPLYLVGIFATSSQTTIAAPSGMTERQERSLSSGTYRITTSVATEVVAAERSGTRSARAGSTATSLGQLMVLRPAR